MCEDACVSWGVVSLAALRELVLICHKPHVTCFESSAQQLVDGCIGQLLCAASFHCAVEVTDHGDRGRVLKRTLASFLKHSLNIQSTSRFQP